MKFATYRRNGREQVGVLDRTGENLLDLAAAAKRSGSADEAFETMLSMIDAGEAAVERAGRLLARFDGYTVELEVEKIGRLRNRVERQDRPSPA